MEEVLKIFEGFAGYGGASFALKKAKIPFECIGYSEINKHAVKCYEQNHVNIWKDKLSNNEEATISYPKNFGDISKINPDDLPDFDLFSGGFPCQDVSIAGSRDLTKGRTNLYLEILRIAKAKKPKYMLLENVKGLLSKVVMGQVGGIEEKLIDKIVRELKNLGYGVCWKLLNSKDYGIPQNRERVWFVCKFGGWDFMEFEFPLKEKLEVSVKDLLQKNVNEKYFLTKKQIKRLKEGHINPKIVHTLTSGGHSGGNHSDMDGFIADFRMDEGLRIREDNVSPTLTNTLRDEPIKPPSHSILVCIPVLTPNREEKRQNGRKFKTDGEPMFTLTGQDIHGIMINKCVRAGGRGSLTKKHSWDLVNDNSEIRRLTPTECFRLMGFTKDEINLEGISNSQRYSLAGNGWDINIVSKIFKKLLVKF